MKNIIISFLFLVLFSVNSDAQKFQRLECFPCQKIEKGCSICDGMTTKGELFQGMVLWNDRVATRLYTPFKKVTYTRSVVTIVDANNDEAKIYVRKTKYNTYQEVLASIEQCKMTLSSDGVDMVDDADNDPTNELDDTDISAVDVTLSGTNLTVTVSEDGTDYSDVVDLSSLISDGSETIVNASGDITVSGSGTVADPYIVGYTHIPSDGSETVITAGANVTVTGTGTSADPYVIASVDTNTQNTVTTSDTEVMIIPTTNVDGTITYDIQVDAEDTFADNPQSIDGIGTGSFDLADGTTITFCEECPVFTIEDNGDGTYNLQDGDGNDVGDTITDTDTNTQNTLSTTDPDITLTPTTNPDGTTNYAIDVQHPTFSDFDTLFQAGTNIAFTGTGTAADPIVISSTGGTDNGDFEITEVTTILANGDTLITYAHVHTTSDGTVGTSYETKAICPLVLTGTVEGEEFAGACEDIFGNISSQETCLDGSDPTFELFTNVDTGFVSLNSDGSFVWHPPSDLVDCPVDIQTFETNVFCGDDLVGTTIDTISIVEPPQALSYGVLNSNSIDKADGTGDFTSSFEFFDSDGVPLDQACIDYSTTCFEARLTIPTVSVPLEATICQGDNSFSNQTADWITYIDPIIQNIVWSGNSFVLDTEKRDGALAITNAQIGDIAGTGQPRTVNHDGTTSQGVDWCIEMRVDANSCNGESNWAKTVIPVKAEAFEGSWSKTSTSTRLAFVLQAVRTQIDNVENNSSILGGDVFDYGVYLEGSTSGILKNWVTPGVDPDFSDSSNGGQVAPAATDVKTYVDANINDEYYNFGVRGKINFVDYPLENPTEFESLTSSHRNAANTTVGLQSRTGIGGATSNFVTPPGTFDRQVQYGISGSAVAIAAQYGTSENHLYTVTNGATVTPSPFTVTDPDDTDNYSFIETSPFPNIYRSTQSETSNTVAPAGFQDSYMYVDQFIFTF